MLEAIYSVQQQRDFQIKQYEYLICKSNYSDQCYRDYLEKSLTIGFGQLREAEYEKISFTKPSIVILSPTLEMNESEIGKITEKLTLSLEKMNQYRKRYAIVHADESSYLIGGYVFDPITKERLAPENDYKYDAKTDVLQPIVPLPNTVVSFGLATDGKYIVMIGGHTPSNKPSLQCYAMEIKNLPEKWISLPDLPISTSGPGVAMTDGEIHVIGGFDIISSESITHGEYYRLTWPVDTQWKQQKSIEPIRARSLVLIIPDSHVPHQRLVYIAGGYDVNTKRRPSIVSNIYMYDENENNWKFITDIPDLKLTHGLSFYEDKLHVSEPVIQMNNECDNQIIRSYNFKTNQWLESSKNGN